MSDNIDSLKKSIGSNTWSLLHTVAATYPQRPSAIQQKHARQFYHRIAEFYPCSYCAKDFRDAIKQHPVRTESREALSVWVCERHNEVNEKLGKPVVNCDRIWEKWGASHGTPSQIDSFDDDDDFDDNDLDIDAGGIFPDDCGFCEDTLGKENANMIKEQLKRAQQAKK